MITSLHSGLCLSEEFRIALEALNELDFYDNCNDSCKANCCACMQNKINQARQLTGTTVYGEPLEF